MEPFLRTVHGNQGITSLEIGGALDLSCNLRRLFIILYFEHGNYTY